MAGFEIVHGQGSEGCSESVVWEEQMLHAVRLEDRSDNGESYRGVEDEEVGEMADRAGEDSGECQEVQGMLEDSDGWGVAFEKRRTRRGSAAAAPPMKQFIAAGIVAERQGGKQFACIVVPGFEAIKLCHMEGDAAFPKPALEVGRSDRLGLLNGDGGLMVGKRRGGVLCHGAESGLEQVGQLTDGTIVEG